MSDYTNFLIGFWAFFFFFSGFAILAFPNLKDYFIEESEKSSTRWFVIILSLSIGLFHTVLHNEWSNGAEIFVSIIGWISLMKAFLLMAFPKLFKLSIYFFESKVLIPMGILILGIGVYLFNSILINIIA